MVAHGRQSSKLASFTLRTELASSEAASAEYRQRALTGRQGTIYPVQG